MWERKRLLSAWGGSFSALLRRGVPSPGQSYNPGLLPASSASGSSGPSFRFQHPLLPRLLVTLYLPHSLNEQNSSPLPGCQPAHPSRRLGTPPPQEESVVSHQEGGWEPEMRVPAPPADASPQVRPTRTPGVPLRAPFHPQLPDCPLETRALSVFYKKNLYESPAPAAPATESCLGSGQNPRPPGQTPPVEAPSQLAAGAELGDTRAAGVRAAAAPRGRQPAVSSSVCAAWLH